jgi:hypothetical protein
MSGKPTRGYRETFPYRRIASAFQSRESVESFLQLTVHELDSMLQRTNPCTHDYQSWYSITAVSNQPNGATIQNRVCAGRSNQENESPLLDAIAGGRLEGDGGHSVQHGPDLVHGGADLSSMTSSGPAAGGGRAPMNRVAHRWPKAASVGTSACRPYSLASWSLVRASHMPWSASRMRETLATGSVGTAPEHDELDRRHVSHGSGEERRWSPPNPHVSSHTF